MLERSALSNGLGQMSSCETKACKPRCVQACFALSSCEQSQAFPTCMLFPVICNCSKQVSKCVTLICDSRYPSHLMTLLCTSTSRSGRGWTAGRRICTKL